MCYGCYDLAGDIVASQHTAMPQIKDIVPSDYDWLQPSSRVQSPTAHPVTPAEYEKHDNTPSGSWFHVSTQPLTPGAKLVPSGGAGGLHDAQPDRWSDESPLRNRKNHVWLAPNFEKARFWRTQFGPDARIYEVKPGDKPQPWNYTGSEGYVAPHAHVIGEVPLNRQERRHPVEPNWNQASRRTMTSAITLYTKPDCQQCVMTKRQLDAHGIPHEVRDVTQDPKAHAFVTGLGYSAAPVVHAGDEDHWSGFRPERIRALLNRDTI